MWLICTHLKSIEWKANAAITALNSWPIWTYTSLTSPSDACSLLQCLRTSCNLLVENKSLRTVLGTSPGYTCGCVSRTTDTTYKKQRIRTDWYQSDGETSEVEMYELVDWWVVITVGYDGNSGLRSSFAIQALFFLSCGTKRWREKQHCGWLSRNINVLVKAHMNIGNNVAGKVHTLSI